MAVVMHTVGSLLVLASLLLVAPAASAKPYVAQAPAMSTYVASHGFEPATDPSADLSALHPMAHSQLEAFLLEGAEAGAKTGDPVLLAWFAAADASLAPWRLTNCGDYNYDIDYDCDVLPWGGNIWQVGLGVQVSDHYEGVAGAFAWAHPNRTPKAVGDEVFRLAAQDKTFPSSVTVASLAANPGGFTKGMHNSYWISVLERDLRVSAYLEAPDASGWPCYRPGYPAWCNWYRQPAKWQEYSDVLSMVIRSWNQLQNEWKSAKVPDVIVDDASAAFSSTAVTSADGKGGWRGRYAWVAASASGGVVGTWSAKLPVAGKWAVSAFVPYGNHATAAGAKIVIEASDGAHTASFDQSMTGGSFQKLGTFSFGTTAKATLANKGAAGEYVGFDALRFHLVEPAPAPQPDAGVDADAGGSSGSGGTGGMGGMGTGESPEGGGAAGAAGSSAEPAEAAPVPGLPADPGGDTADAGTIGGKAGETEPLDAAGCSTSGGGRPAAFGGLWLILLGLTRGRRHRRT